MRSFRKCGYICLVVDEEIVFLFSRLSSLVSVEGVIGLVIFIRREKKCTFYIVSIFIYGYLELKYFIL